ncbi:hypothetical protein GmHk_16G046967 [Glycine max]|nr:hypothetical protein GmHk_16G046967 [Glycine max]
MVQHPTANMGLVAPRDMFLPPTSQRDDHHSDDLSCLQHLLVTGRPIDHVPSLFNREVVKILLVAHLGILTKIEATTATNASARVRLTWLEDPYHCYVELSSYVWVAMTYLLHLINSTIFVSKSSTHIHSWVYVHLLSVGYSKPYEDYVVEDPIATK